MVKKILISFLILVFLNNSIFCFLPAPQQPLGPQATLRPIDIAEFGKPNQMINILPGRPIAAKDKYGNRLYFTPDGKLALKINKDGTRVFNLTTKTKEYDKEGNLQTVVEKKQGSNLVVIKNEKGQILGYQELGLGGKVLREYDKDMNLIKSYHYNKYGKSIECVVDELSLTKTVFDDKGRPLHDVDFEGNKIAFYYYYEDNPSKLHYKEDVYGNKTYFDKKGNMLYTEDFEGNVFIKYFYKKDEKGNLELEKVVDLRTNDTVYYQKGRPVYMTNYTGSVQKEYHYDGTTLVFLFDKETKETTYYDLNGKPIYTTYNEHIIKEWVYYKGRLIGFYDDYTKTTLIYQYQREDVVLKTDKKPSAEEIQKWYDEGLIEKLRNEKKNEL